MSDIRVLIRFSKEAWAEEARRPYRFAHLRGCLDGRFYDPAFADAGTPARFLGFKPDFLRGSAEVTIDNPTERDLAAFRAWPGMDPEEVELLVVQEALCA